MLARLHVSPNLKHKRGDINDERHQGSGYGWLTTVLVDHCTNARERPRLCTKTGCEFGVAMPLRLTLPPLRLCAYAGLI